ncbi:DUF4388 domain-containing protein [Candidatus Uabimicrobium sp. HlEnr_7]|uniref:DUF4388 domain-containing protein n=1 Tax=Candidatus Uabimicrobium helgolandensis TaxID=3095367 RepID=UPI003555D460
MSNFRKNENNKSFELKKTKRIQRKGPDSLISQIISIQKGDKIARKVLPGNYLECFPFPRIRLNKKQDFYIGRSDDNDLVLKSSDVSRKHAVVKWSIEDNAYIVCDLESANGIYVNTQPCERRMLKDKDTILVGEHNVSYYTISELTNGKSGKGAETTILKKRSDVIEKLSLQGSLDTLDLGTVLQMIATEKKTGYIKIEGKDARGYIHFNDGFVVHSEVGTQKGEEAFFHIMEWNSGNFNFVHNVQPIQFTMDDEVQYLLMEVAHRQDEQSKTEY